MRNMVEHMQMVGQRKWISLSGISCFKRLTKFNSVPMAHLDPEGEERTAD